MNDMRQTIVPKSDQLNADDLIAGPITITVTEVRIRGGQEQPVSIHYEGDNGKPYKSCKSMNRVLVAAWGADASQYAGRRMTLYRDPSVRWGGMEVGGIRISHLSDIDATMTMALTATKGSRKPFTVKPLPAGEAQHNWTEDINQAADLRALQAVWKAIPADQKPRYEAAKDARKAALSQPQQPEEMTAAKAIAAIQRHTDIDAMAVEMDTFPEAIKSDADVQRAFRDQLNAIKGK